METRTVWTLLSWTWVFRKTGPIASDAPVDGGVQDILNAAVPELSGHGKPELGPLGLALPETPKLPLAGEVGSRASRVALDMAASPHLHVDRVQVDGGIYRVERSCLPCLEVVRVGVRQVRDQRRRDLHLEDLLQAPPPRPDNHKALLLPIRFVGHESGRSQP